jgi:hypothetical protein
MVQWGTRSKNCMYSNAGKFCPFIICYFFTEYSLMNSIVELKINKIMENMNSGELCVRYFSVFSIEIEYDFAAVYPNPLRPEPAVCIVLIVCDFHFLLLLSLLTCSVLCLFV